MGDSVERAVDRPILVIFDRKTRACWSHMVPRKGDDRFAIKCVVTAIERLGYKELVLKCDNEESIKNLARAVKRESPSDIILEHNPPYDKQAAGEVERAVQTMTGLIRTHRVALENGAGMAITPSSSVFAWLVTYVVHLHNFFHLSTTRKDGMTPYHRMKGRPWRLKLPRFGEVVDYKTRGKGKFENKWQRGVFIGIKESTTEKVAAGDEKVYLVQSIKRVGDGEYNKELLSKVLGTPWNPDGDKDAKPADIIPPQVILPPQGQKKPRAKRGHSTSLRVS